MSSYKISIQCNICLFDRHEECTWLRVLKNEYECDYGETKTGKKFAMTLSRPLHILLFK